MSQSVAQVVAKVAVDLDDAFELDAGELATTNVRFLRDRKAATPTPATLTECVPLLSLTLELIKSGPETLSIDSIEEYRADALRLIERIRPVIERQAGLTLSDWAADVLAQRAPA